MLVDVAREHVDVWPGELAQLTSRMGYLFARPEPREVLADLTEGLLSDLGRKNGWTMADHAEHADALLPEVHDYIVTRLGDEQATPVLDDTHPVGRGGPSALRQYRGRTQLPGDGDAHLRRRLGRGPPTAPGRRRA